VRNNSKGLFLNENFQYSSKRVKAKANLQKFRKKRLKLLTVDTILICQKN